LQVVLVKHPLSDPIGWPSKVTWIIAEKSFLHARSTLTLPHADHRPRLKGNCHDHPCPYIRTPPLARRCEKFRADVEIRMLHFLPACSLVVDY
jgi:hypothetical protein